MPAANQPNSSHTITLGTLPEWYMLGARCSRCTHHGWLNRSDLTYRFGRKTSLLALEPRLRCTPCGNRTANEFKVAHIKR